MLLSDQRHEIVFCEILMGHSISVQLKHQ